MLLRGIWLHSFASDSNEKPLQPANENNNVFLIFYNIQFVSKTHACCLS